MSQTVLRSPHVAVADAPKAPRVAPSLVIGRIETGIPVPSRAKNPLEDILTDLPVSASVPIAGAEVKYIRNQVATYRRQHGLPNGCFTVHAQDDGTVRIWRRK